MSQTRNGSLAQAQQQSVLASALREMLDEFPEDLCTVPDQRRARRIAEQALVNVHEQDAESDAAKQSDSPTGVAQAGTANGKKITLFLEVSADSDFPFAIPSHVMVSINHAFLDRLQQLHVAQQVHHLSERRQAFYPDWVGTKHNIELPELVVFGDGFAIYGYLDEVRLTSSMVDSAKLADAFLNAQADQRFVVRVCYIEPLTDDLAAEVNLQDEIDSGDSPSMG
jgi:hypothetical protein